ncbi:SPOR domain-containing protein [Croceiramulus getboli]|nr:SPOR domain-containing protein [Flavobacteriaceae bacterium YJPT1-3]
MTKKWFFSFLLIGTFSMTLLAQQGTVVVKQDKRIDDLLVLKSQMSKDNELSDRYKIQLYYGNRAEATNIRKKYLNKIGEWPSSIEYQTPNYKVWIGNFRNKLEADRALIRIHEVFPNAFIFKPER